MFKRLLPVVIASCAVCAAFAPLGAWAQTARPAEPRAQAERRSETPEPVVRRTVIEDQGARISELRVRGAVRNITVQPKGAAEYEVLAPDAGRDTSSGPNSSKGAAGQRVWRVLSF